LPRGTQKWGDNSKEAVQIRKNVDGPYYSPGGSRGKACMLLTFFSRVKEKISPEKISSVVPGEIDLGRAGRIEGELRFGWGGKCGGAGLPTVGKEGRCNEWVTREDVRERPSIKYEGKWNGHLGVREKLSHKTREKYIYEPKKKRTKKQQHKEKREKSKRTTKKDKGTHHQKNPF